MTDDFTCPICCKKTLGLSAVSLITKTSKVSWESDSTMRLLDWEKAEVQLRFCWRCFHAVIFPKFDAEKLYGDKGFQVRKEIYGSYFPDKEYGGKEENLSFCRDILSVSREFLRLHKITAFVAKYAKTTFKDIKEIRILDWGGGDGYLSKTYGAMLSGITGLTNRNFVFDYSDWRNTAGNKVGIEDLKGMEPFHIIILSHILEHTHDPIRSLRSALSFSENKGLIICEVPDERHNIFRAMFRKKIGLNYHVSYFSKRSLHKALELSGLSNINTVYQNNSSYRGRKMSCIAGIAQCGDDLPAKNLMPTVLEEIVSLVIFTVRKVKSKVLSCFIMRNCNNN